MQLLKNLVVRTSHSIVLSNFRTVSPKEIELSLSTTQLSAMAAYGRNNGLKMATQLTKILTGSSNSRSLCGIVNSEVITSHTAKWMQDTSKKSPMELINEVPPIIVEGRIVACEGDNNPALGHPIEFICLDKKEPAICKYCGLRYAQDHHH